MMIFAIVRVVCSYKWGLLGVGCCCWRWGTLTRQQPQKRTKHFIHHRISFPSIFHQIIHQGFWEWINDWIFQEDFFGAIYDGYSATWCTKKWWRHKICIQAYQLSVCHVWFIQEMFDLHYKDGIQLQATAMISWYHNNHHRVWLLSWFAWQIPYR